MRIKFRLLKWRNVIACGLIGLFIAVRLTVYSEWNKANVPKREGRMCNQKVKDIAFLKVHKCGSTTTSNILQRFGMQNNLNFVLPDKPREGHFWVLGNLNDTKWNSIIPVPTGQVYNILSVDTFYNKQAYNKFIPKNAFFLAILRDPVERFISMEFYEMRAYKSMEKYGTDPFVFAHIKDDPNTDEISAIRGMSYDFGLPVPDRNKEEEIDSLIEHIDTEFDFVMIMEYFDISLVILKRKLCWELKDIVYIKRNSNSFKKDYALDPRTRQTIFNIQHADTKMYDHFKQKLFHEIVSSGSSLQHEVHHFQNILKNVNDFCLFRKSGFVEIPASSWNEAFRIDIKMCKLMLMDEFDLVYTLQERQRKIMNDSLSNNMK